MAVMVTLYWTLPALEALTVELDPLGPNGHKTPSPISLPNLKRLHLSRVDCNCLWSLLDFFEAPQLGLLSVLSNQWSRRESDSLPLLASVGWKAPQELCVDAHVLKRMPPCAFSKIEQLSVHDFTSSLGVLSMTFDMPILRTLTVFGSHAFQFPHYLRAPLLDTCRMDHFNSFRRTGESLTGVLSVWTFPVISPLPFSNVTVIETWLPVYTPHSIHPLTSFPNVITLTVVVRTKNLSWTHWLSPFQEGVALTGLETIQVEGYNSRRQDFPDLTVLETSLLEMIHERNRAGYPLKAASYRYWPYYKEMIHE